MDFLSKSRQKYEELAFIQLFGRYSVLNVSGGSSKSDVRLAKGQHCAYGLFQYWIPKTHNMHNNFVFNMPAKASKFTVYFWNIKKSGFEIHAGELTISELGPVPAAKNAPIAY
jgi:hypothetical protein